MWFLHQLVACFWYASEEMISLKLNFIPSPIPLLLTLGVNDDGESIRWWFLKPTKVNSGGSGKLDKKVFFLSEALPG
jgi:hypothetical protein